MKSLVTALFSVPLLLSGLNSFATTPDDLVPVMAGTVVCGGGPQAKQRIRNINDDLHVVIDSIVISDGGGISRYDSDTHGFAPWSATNPPVIGPRQTNFAE